MSTLTQTLNELSAFLKRNPNCGHAKVVAKNLSILASDTDDNTKADVSNVLWENVKRFATARGAVLPKNGSESR